MRHWWLSYRRRSAALKRMRPAQLVDEKVISHGTGATHVRPAASLFTCCYQEQLWLCERGQTRGLEQGLESTKAPARDTGLGHVEGRALQSLGGQGQAHEESKEGYAREEL